MKRPSFHGAVGRGRREPPADPQPARPRKWLPVIDTEDCGGCGRCVEACDEGCLEMIWSFATLVRPGTCSGGARCVDACRTDVIHMQWVEQASELDVGRWDV